MKFGQLTTLIEKTMRSLDMMKVKQLVYDHLHDELFDELSIDPFEGNADEQIRKIADSIMIEFNWGKMEL